MESDRERGRNQSAHFALFPSSPWGIFKKLLFFKTFDGESIQKRF